MSEHKENTRRMAEQRWLIDKTIETAGVDFSWPMTGVTLGAVGLNVVPDIMSIRLRVKKYADITREFVRVAAKREAMAKRAEDDGHDITALWPLPVCDERSSSAGHHDGGHLSSCFAFLWM